MRGWPRDADHTAPEEIDADQNAGEESQRRQGECSAEAATAIGEACRGGRLGSARPGQVVSKMWEYIRSHNLQNRDNRREILADDKLRKVFGKDS
jgi:hypothetical protein